MSWIVVESHMQWLKYAKKQVGRLKSIVAQLEDKDNSMDRYLLRLVSCTHSYNLFANEEKYDTWEDKQEDLGEGYCNDDQEGSERWEGTFHVNLEAKKHLEVENYKMLFKY